MRKLLALCSVMVVGIIAANICQAIAATVTRGPYLQLATPSSIVIRWQTDDMTDSVVRYGDAPNNLTGTAVKISLTTEHEIAIDGLSPNTRYYYSVGSSDQTLSGGDTGHFFTTAPLSGNAKPTRIWVVGDSGAGDENALAVRDSYKSFAGAVVTDLWFMLGDNAYPDGTQEEYELALFDIYPELLRKVVLWPSIGNHDVISSANPTGAYFEIFTLPTNGEAGGVPSGTETYYSFDYGSIHFVVLETSDSDLSMAGPVSNWLESDLSVNDKDWTIAYWHHPPYSKGNYNSDSSSKAGDLRQNILPILEQYGTDLVLAGHSHVYERSHLLNGHYGQSNTLTSSMILDDGGGREDGSGAYNKPQDLTNAGTVYVVAGSSSRDTNSGTLDHSAMFFSSRSLGSLIIEIVDNRLDAKFLDDGGNVLDYFTILKGPDISPPILLSARAGGLSNVIVEFSEPLDQITAETVGNYTLDNGVGIFAAELSDDGRSVRLDTTPLVDGVSYTLLVNNIEDRNGNVIIENSETQFNFAAVQTKSFRDGVAPTLAYAGTRDTYISQDMPDMSFTNATELVVDGDTPSGTGLDLYALLRWDVSDIPNTAQVEGATIAINVTGTSSRTYELYQVGRDWSEDATWNNYAPGSPWMIPGALGDLDRGTAVLGVAAADSLGSHTITLNQEGVSLVQAWVDGNIPNFGLILADETASNGLDFNSREASSSLTRPMLAVTYSLPAGGGDQIPPEQPTDLTLVAKMTVNVSLAWQPCAGFPGDPCDNIGIAGYKVYRDGLLIGAAAEGSYDDAGLVADTTYRYEVSSYDAAGNESLLSLPLDVTTEASPRNVTPTVDVVDPPNGSSFTAGQSVTLTATADDPEDGDLTAGLSWTSDLDGALGSGGTVTASALSVGTHVITAAATDSGGLTGSDQVTVTVADSAVVTSPSGQDGYGTWGGPAQDRHLQTTITIKSASGTPIAGASVTATLSGPATTSATQITDSAGQVSLKITNAPSGIYTTNVSAVSANGFLWNGVTPSNSFSKP